MLEGRDSHGYALGGKIAITKHDIPASRYLGKWDKDGPMMEYFVIPKGTRVKVVMQSRFGDVGITTNLDANSGYSARVDAIDSLDFGGGPTMPADVPITLVPWFDAKDKPPDNDRLVLTELGTSHYAWGDWWALQRDTMNWRCHSDPPPRVWCDPSPPDMSGPLGPLTVRKLGHLVWWLEHYLDPEDEEMRGITALLRRALDALPPKEDDNA